MVQRTAFTTITALPQNITRPQAISFLHDHLNMIDLNPLVKNRHPIPAPSHSPPEELSCQWYSITDTISYLPGGLFQGEIHYTASFHDLPTGIQTHSYAAMGVEIKGVWTIGGNERGERPEPRELGSEAPAEGLYLKEECEVKCAMIMTRFIKKTILKSHGKLVEDLKEKAMKYGSPQEGGDGGRGRDQRQQQQQYGGATAARSCSPNIESPRQEKVETHTRTRSEGWTNFSNPRRQQNGYDSPTSQAAQQEQRPKGHISAVSESNLAQRRAATHALQTQNGQQRQNFTQGQQIHYQSHGQQRHQFQSQQQYAAELA